MKITLDLLKAAGICEEGEKLYAELGSPDTWALGKERADAYVKANDATATTRGINMTWWDSLLTNPICVKYWNNYSRGVYGFRDFFPDNSKMTYTWIKPNDYTTFPTLAEVIKARADLLDKYIREGKVDFDVLKEESVLVDKMFNVREPEYRIELVKQDINKLTEEGKYRVYNYELNKYVNCATLSETIQKLQEVKSGYAIKNVIKQLVTDQEGNKAWDEV
jgi:hypothetical protein